MYEKYSQFQKNCTQNQLPEYGSSIAQPPVLADRIRSFLKIVGMISKPQYNEAVSKINIYKMILTKLIKIQNIANKSL